ncbi:Glycosyl transferase, group 1 [Sulfitobacter noctilucae]|uniref:glycosyltransferase family 4 protein n=1 Tax=Sulfitobacter noctilucae TaxID=1342302 RepID=UPI000468CF74|nr:glycosyltransferase family 1 protein [Sulfitobacter noctilucae]KIN70127.1 Glycosyl transferase, group 1 [Sulfitobacter noctilucae]
MKTYFFDVSDVVIYVEKETSVSGIQRVSFEVIRRMVAQHGAGAVRLAYWDRSKRVYLSIPSDFIEGMTGFDADVLGAVFFGKQARALQDTAPTLARYRNHPLKYWFHHLNRSFHALRGDAAYFERLGSSLAEWRAFNPGRPSAPVAQDIARTPVAEVARPGDALVVLGATWAIDGLQACFQGLADEQGMQITQLVHDLIPVLTPEHIVEDFSQEFYDWLKTSTGYCSSYFANSQNTARDLAGFLEEVGVQRPIRTVPLAQAFDKAPQTPEAHAGMYGARVASVQGMRREILNLSRMPFVLVVGTLESRKNIWRLAQVWQRLSREEELELPRLVFAGKRGWHIEDFNALMQATGNLGGWVQFADRPSDAELAYLYETCLFTAMVSLYEGWGLPIGESLAFGKTGVVADNSSMPEVGGDMVEYCDATSIDSIAGAVRKLVAEPDYREGLEARIAGARLRTWDDVAADFVAALEG